MRFKKLIMQFLIIAIFFVFTCCTSTREITMKSELNNPSEVGDITVETTKGKTFELHSYRLKNDTLRCKGTDVTGSTDIPFDGKIPLSEIKQISSTEINWGSSILAIGAVTTFSILLIHNLKADNSMTNEVHIIYPSGGGGCGMANIDGSEISAGGFPGFSDGEYKCLNIKQNNSVSRFEIISEQNGFKLKSIPAADNSPESSITIDLSGENAVITFGNN